jgi:hypothetical protein
MIHCGCKIDNYQMITLNGGCRYFNWGTDGDVHHAGNQAQAGIVSLEFTIRYILGQTSDYDGFVRQWLASGGQALLDEAAQQLRGYGRIR